MPNTKEILAKCWEGKEEPSKNVPKFSFEYFPPKTDKGVEKLYNTVWRMNKQNPLFVDLTWGAGGSTSDLTMQMSTNFKKLFGAEVNMHLTCTNITAESVKQALVTARDNGITSICALRGDPPKGQDKWASVDGGFNCALDLVKFIRKEHGDHFAIAVAGYPEGHPDAIKEVTDESKLTAEEKGRIVKGADGKVLCCHEKEFKGELDYLKQKVDAGANMILTQLFYDVDVFLAFVKRCRDAGINVPILPGIMPLGTFGGFTRMTGFCKTRIPDDLKAKLEAVKDDADAFKAAGVEYITAMCKRIWATNEVPALHFYSLNQDETTFNILKNLGVTLNPLDEAEAEKVAKMISDTLATQSGPESPTKKPKTDV
jgi:methylenetetrahydrofolate reductase (NADPH)